MVLHIKNMVSNRCVMAVKLELDKVGLGYSHIDLGEVETKENPTQRQFEMLRCALLELGFELISDKKEMLIEKIKNTIIDMVHHNIEMPKIKNSNYISEKIHHDYTYLANVFSQQTGLTIEHYIIKHKIERVKELILYKELNLTEISHLLNYSSVAHLSRQFKKVTGLTVSYFKNTATCQRIALENI
ncbi:AraC family transcriptional regulator [Pedobacter sp. PACM 27299]|uniref:helix-turn-helix domain-containing protein n=1 Tax=Pedobacter sp. PACM 27299 TaxID=1727164 RepID=UPI000705DAA1|nr:AraC family transcriptional regulator [Pedobacter sp. PACM 27299]ALL06245.1 AraC family transcriptional regulator [Pedobacter sp. PACM 27299]